MVTPSESSIEHLQLGFRVFHLEHEFSSELADFSEQNGVVRDAFDLKKLFH